MLVLYGSQTGTAQDLAERIWRQAKRRHFQTILSALDDYSVGDLIYEKLVVVVASTTGQGEVPDNMKKFWKFIMRKNLPNNSLEKLSFGVIGLGDSSYVKYNVVAKKLFKRFAQLGGTPLLEQPCLGDDQHDLGYSAAVDPWLEQFWSQVMRRHPLPAGLSVIGDHIPLPTKLRARFIENGAQVPSWEDAIHRDAFMARLISNERVTAADHWQDVRLLKFDIASSNLKYAPGDVMVVQPENLDEHVEDFYQLFPFSPEQIVSIESNDANLAPMGTSRCTPSLCRIDDLVRKYFDLQRVPERSFFELLAQYGDHELEKEKLLEFCADTQERYSYCNRMRRTMLEVLQDFPNTTARLSLNHLLELFPSIKPRAFSIASSYKAHPGELHILVAVVQYRTKMFRPRKGLCSNYLAGMDPSNEVRVPLWIKEGSFKFPADQRPVIMVGPGTGVAPFRNLILERVVEAKAENYLFFGCRNEKNDFYCASDWKPLEERGMLRLFTAFSRDQEEKVYVTDRLREQAALLWKLLSEENADFYIAGNAKRMPEDVQAALKHVCMSVGHHKPAEADEFLKKLEQTGRYQAETWS